MKYYSGSGDAGQTSLLGGKRVSKGDYLIEVLGTFDEANASLAICRSVCENADVISCIYQIQKDLSGLMGELAAFETGDGNFIYINQNHLNWLEAKIESFSNRLPPFKSLIIPGDSYSGALINASRAAVRRAERRLVTFFELMEYENYDLLQYVNRLSSLCFVLVLFNDHALKEGNK
ncbi:MAG: cob(I)yrinic acid a,c-diamide adenosyltransferase [Anaerolineaceae bacterium]|nr:cob(I)yrinic acid a,c-diamide adenosyltransferase [Anaerolineaceae bacterium]